MEKGRFHYRDIMPKLSMRRTRSAIQGFIGVLCTVYRSSVGEINVVPLVKTQSNSQ